MPEAMTQKQIDDLLNNLKQGSVDITRIEDDVGRKTKEYDFRSPKKFTREQIKLLDSIYENFSRLCSLQLSSMLGIGCQMEVIQIEEQEFLNFNNALGDSILAGLIDISKDDPAPSDEPQQILVEMSRSTSFSIMDKLLGGSGDGHNVTRDYTDIEISILEYLFKMINDILKRSWMNYIDISTRFVSIETNSRLLQSISPEETVIIVSIEITLKSLKGNINICMPKNALDIIFQSFEAKYTKAPKRGDIEAEKIRKEEIMKQLKDTPLDVTGILGQSEITLRDLVNLQVGDIIPLETQITGSNIIIKVEDIAWFMGVMGTKKKKYAVKIDETIVDL